MTNISAKSLKDGNVLLSMDYSELEDRVLLHYINNSYEVYTHTGNNEEATINSFKNCQVAKKFWSKEVKRVFWEEIAYFDVQSRAEVLEDDGKVSLFWRGRLVRRFENELQAKVVGGTLALVCERNFDKLWETIKRVEIINESN